MEYQYPQPRRDPEYGFPSSQSAIEFATESSCTYVEILHSGAPRTTTSRTTYKTGFLNEDGLNQYLNESTEGASGLRLFMGSCTYNSETQCSVLPFSQTAMAQLKKQLCLPDEFDSAMQSRCARAFKSSCSASGSTCYIFKFSIYRPSYYHLALHHSPLTNLTTALLISKTSDHAFPTLISTLLSPSLGPKTTDPFLLPTLIAQLVTASADTRVQTQDTMLNVLEESMGQHVYVNRPVGNPLEIDFVDTTRRLSAVSRVLQVEKRTESQVAVVYQFMAQKDSKISLSLAETSTTIAEESKKDSAAMKAIAVLTMCFLPGTFLAAIFAMPFFVWDSGSPVLKGGFKWYWAIAIPLTLVVLLLWGLGVWLPWSEWMRRVRFRRGGTRWGSDIEDGKVKGGKEN